MKMLRWFLAIALAYGCAGMAKADDFQMVVVDPVPNANLVTPIYSDDFSVTLSRCQSSQLDGLSPATYLGCFTGLNLTGAPLTSLQILIPIFDYPNGSPQTAGCAAVTQDLFSTVTCGTTANGLDYYVDLSGGDIPTAVNGGDCDYDGDAGHLNQDDIDCDTASIFTIAEAGVPAHDFPTDLPADANATVTPEPSSILLLSTGVLSIGLFGAFRRRSLGAPLAAWGVRRD